MDPSQVNLSGFYFMKFFIFFNEYFLSHPLLRFSSRLPFLRVMPKNSIKLIVSDIDFFFDSYTRRLLPHTNNYWLEITFYFENKFKLKNDSDIRFYIQYFLNNNFLECQK